MTELNKEINCYTLEYKENIGNVKQKVRLRLQITACRKQTTGIMG